MSQPSRKQAYEKKEQIFREAKTALDGSLHDRNLATQRKEEDQRQVQESLDAVAAASATLSNFEAYGKAEQALRVLQDQQAQKSRLEKKRAEATNLKTDCEGKARSARQQAENYGKQKATKAEASQNLNTQISEGHKSLLDTRAQFQQIETTTNNARQSRDACEHWLKATRNQIDSNADLLAEILEDWTKIESWRPASLSEARAHEEEFDKGTKALAKKLAEAEKLKETLAEQLEQIGGGVCPFLKEKCRQFDAKKIRSDVSAHQEEIKQLTNQQSEATDAHRRAKALVERLAKEEARLAQTRKATERKVESFIKAHNKLLSTAARQHFGVLGDYLPKHAARLRIQPLAEAIAGECFDKSGEVLNARMMTGLAEAEMQLHAEVAGILSSIATDLESELKSFERQRDERLGKERDLKNKQGNLDEIEGEIKVLTANIEAQDDLGRKADEQAGAAGKCITDIDGELVVFVNVERELKEQRILKDQNTDGHAKYLGARPYADRLAQRQRALKQSTETEALRGEAVRQKQTAFDQVKGEFDPTVMALARKRSEDIAQQFATESAHLENARRELGREQARFVEWQAAAQERDEVQLACGKLLACIELTQKARHILQKAAPMVAQHVCQRIAGRAQQIFNQINTDPVELEWNSERYGLRIARGERRFAMLSGGEQTKLALAMTMAMIQEFCGLRFCVFDEPTYGVDADSRHKLADAIVRLQDVNENKLDQILLVSHDDAFEGMIENVVRIQKTANEGSVPLIST